MPEVCRLYLVSPPEIELQLFSDQLKSALDGGDVACLQLRLKNRAGTPAPDDEVLRAAERMLTLCHPHDVALLINDRPDLARKAGADGVHVGQSDATVGEARAVLGDEATIGVTCHASTHLALLAGEAGADYVAFGAFYPTETKDAPTRAELQVLEWWRFATTVPSVAIGGITPENCGALVRAGADFVAASSAVWKNPDGPAAAVAAFNRAIAEARG